jgi:hypothetical protein
LDFEVDSIDGYEFSELLAELAGAYQSFRHESDTVVGGVDAIARDLGPYPWLMTAASDRGDLRRLTPGLTLMVRVAMYGVAAFSLASMIATINEITAFDTLVQRVGNVAASDLAEAELMSEAFVSLAFWTGVAAGGLTIVWWYRAYRSVEAKGPTGLSWSPRWAVGGWFIPLGNAVIPKLVLNEIDRLSQGDIVDDSWRERSTTLLANIWWVVWVAGVVVAFVGATMVASETVAATFDADAYRSGLLVSVAGFAVSTVAGFLGAATVRVIGERLHGPA